MLKVGDKVRFTGETCKHCDVHFNNEMMELVKRYKGKKLTVNKVQYTDAGSRVYRLKGINWSWTDVWIKKVVANNKVGGKLNENKSKA